VEVRAEPFDERSEPGPSGLYEWIYVGTNFHFSEDDAAPLVFRRYDDSPEVATLVSPAGWQPDVYTAALFRAATAFLREDRGIRSVHVYNPASGAFASLTDAAMGARRLGLDHAVPDCEAAT
jgi:hypothetical protein